MYTHTYVYMCIYIYTHYIHMCMCVQIYVCMYVYIYIYTHTYDFAFAAVAFSVVVACAPMLFTNTELCYSDPHHTHTTAKGSSTNVMLCPFVLCCLLILGGTTCPTLPIRPHLFSTALLV